MEPDASWLWSRKALSSPSCQSPDVVSNAKMCDGDATSVVIHTDGQQPECLSAHLLGCKFDMHDLDQLDFDMHMEGCRWTWTAPLWLTPDLWETSASGGDSGEVDMLETCPAYALASNFATGGEQKRYWFADPNNVTLHLTMKKEAENSVAGIKVKACQVHELRNGQCTFGTNGFIRDHAHYPDIYGANACTKGDCLYHFVSDIWNGEKGDGGRSGCAFNRWHRSSGCGFSVQNIRIKGRAAAFKGECAALLANSDVAVV